jgi:hypothetical protein
MQLKQIFCFIFLSAPGLIFCQRETHGNSGPWEVFAGYIQPFGKWTDKVDFYEENGYGSPGYYNSFAGQTGMHMMTGFSAGLSFNKTFLKKDGSQNNFELLFNPCVLDLLVYDLESNGPAMTSSHIMPLMQYEISGAPCYVIDEGRKYNIKVFTRLGFSFKNTSGKVHFERSNFAASSGLPHSTTYSDVYIDYTTYSYTGAGAAFAPGLKFTSGRIGIGAEFHFEFTTGTYHGYTAYKDSYGNYVPNIIHNDKISNTVFGSKFLNVQFTYAFGKER